MEHDNIPRESELLDAVERGLADGACAALELRNSLLQSVDAIRLGASGQGQVMARFARALESLTLMTDLVRELRKGLRCLGIEANPFSAWDRAGEGLAAMVSALENRDWIFLADTIQYELCPLLEETEKSAGATARMLAGSRAADHSAAGHQSRSTM